MQTETTLSWKRKFSALGPGILMASAAIGGSHIIASTQAGAIYGWQLAIIIILANLFKYPFFRFGVQYTLDTGNTLLDGYRQKGKVYLWIFFLLNIFSTVINMTAISLLSAVILNFVLPNPISVSILSSIMICTAMAILLMGKYRMLDGLAKIIMLALTVTTVTAVVIALMRNGIQGVAPDDYISPSPWNIASLAFIVALMGWMPAPIELSAINSMWVVAKRRLTKVSYKEGIFDFNVGYISTAILALVFLALGALVQFGAGESVQMVGGKYIEQLINMYASTIGEWAKELIAFIAFMCIFGTTISMLDGYSRTNLESLRLLIGTKESRLSFLNLSILFSTISVLIVIFGFNDAVGPMLKLAMIGSFVSTPVFSWLNLSLVMKGEHRVKGGLFYLSLIGLVYLAGFTLLFIVSQIGWLE
ncbi:NRAMP family divalent metal transporter [Avibacterium paragallinarum]|uniref:Divalent metal cation transporter n=1 Tax=Avibacterium paragallinarum TaxID=728 RepID=A0AAE5TIC7_AVIPA|nr:NRAMP family divalent metal transporter [Avibacterium paragallinarum]MEE3609741.1 NRAMP family divalent metal transporter [Avibacterium paragallinarum]MEE3622246.1 NRAMP family divalent metal transporter [Avibacterium paragallinarum]MEE3669531.1 NRAMP family divalent metal transporter [Avibacterium paragallinarum]MEE3681847.1 NRAMP family divalent metal transporter [Avibacterium paragallinarum]MEE4387063.1 NRAMP family divalent metal transporter [Avibacterium paragallinarum]